MLNFLHIIINYLSKCWIKNNLYEYFSGKLVEIFPVIMVNLFVTFPTMYLMKYHRLKQDLPDRIVLKRRLEMLTMMIFPN